MGKARDKFKVYNNVFDEFTVNIIRKLMSSQIIDGLHGGLSLGKEANVFLAKKDDKPLIVKIYRLTSCNFNKMYEYLVVDNTYEGVKRSKRQIVLNWVRREYRNLNRAYKFGVNVPLPICLNNHVIVMSLLGQDETPAPMLKDAWPENPQEFLEKIKEQIILLYKSGLVHGDLSEFNIINWDEKPYLIDFSQSTMTDNYSHIDLLKRDLGNIKRFFNKMKVDFDDEAFYKVVINSTKKKVKDD